MKQYLRLLTSLSLLLIALAGCSGSLQTHSSDMEEKFQTIFPETDMNKSFRIRVNSNEKNFPMDSKIQLLINNESSNFISFPSDESHIKLLMDHENEWVEVKNGMTYSGLLILSPKGTPLLDFGTTRVKPILDDFVFSGDKQDKLIRIVMIGEIMKDDQPTGKLVGAYVDVNMSP